MTGNPLSEFSPADLNNKISEFLSKLTKDTLRCNIRETKAVGSEVTEFKMQITRISFDKEGNRKVLPGKHRYRN